MKGYDGGTPTMGEERHLEDVYQIGPFMHYGKISYNGSCFRALNGLLLTRVSYAYNTMSKPNLQMTLFTLGFE